MSNNPRVPDQCPARWMRYTVREGDTMFRIARRASIDLDTLIDANPHIPDPDVLFVGDVLCVPAEPPKRVPDQCPTGWVRYTVREGDTMFRIARELRVNIDRLIDANPHIPDPNVLFVGDVLCVPGERLHEPGG